MCIIVAKYFDGIGWAGAKNRDRNYTPVLDFIEDEKDGIDRMMMHDQITGYKEGINSSGVSILNTSLDVYDDESEVEAGTAKTSPDGQTIVTGAGDETLRFWNLFPAKRTQPQTVSILAPCNFDLR